MTNTFFSLIWNYSCRTKASLIAQVKSTNLSIATVYLLQKKDDNKKESVSFGLLKVSVRCFTMTCGCHMSFGVFFARRTSECVLCRDLYVRLKINLPVRLCVCVCVFVPFITASVLALQRLTTLFYPDLYNQCHISNTTNQILPVSTLCTLADTHTHTQHTTCPSCSQLATILCQTDAN